MKVLITGITGMIGAALSKHLKEQGHDVSGISRDTSEARMSWYKHYLGDILDKEFLKKTMLNFKPDVVYHLAAQAFNGSSWEKEDTTYLVNIQGSKSVFEACRDWTEARVIPACSSAEYGMIKIQPIKETQQLNPISPYGVSKACMEMMGKQFALNYNMDFVFPRLFIHVGIGHPPATLIQNLAKQFVLCLKNGDMMISHGNTNTIRDYVDIDDGVIALELLMNSGVSGEVYNVCSGEPHGFREIINHFAEISGVEYKGVIDARLIRRSDEEVLIGNPSKINKLGWETKIPFKETLEKVFNDWKERI